MSVVAKPAFANGHSRIIPGHPASPHQSIHQVVVNKLLGLSHIESRWKGFVVVVVLARYESFIGPTWMILRRCPAHSYQVHHRFTVCFSGILSGGGINK